MPGWAHAGGEQRLLRRQVRLGLDRLARPRAQAEVAGEPVRLARIRAQEVVPDVQPASGHDAALFRRGEPDK